MPAPQVRKGTSLFDSAHRNGEVHMWPAVNVHTVCALQKHQHAAQLTVGDALQLGYTVGKLSDAVLY